MISLNAGLRMIGRSVARARTSRTQLDYVILSAAHTRTYTLTCKHTVAWVSLNFICVCLCSMYSLVLWCQTFFWNIFSHRFQSRYRHCTAHSHFTSKSPVFYHYFGRNLHKCDQCAVQIECSVLICDSQQRNNFNLFEFNRTVKFINTIESAVKKNPITLHSCLSVRTNFILFISLLRSIFQDIFVYRGHCYTTKLRFYQMILEFAQTFSTIFWNIL